MLTVPKTRELKGRDSKNKGGRTDPVAFVIKESNSLDTKLNTPDKMPELPALVDPISRRGMPVSQSLWCDIPSCLNQFEEVLVEDKQSLSGQTYLRTKIEK